MKLLFVADGRSPIALNWIRYFVDEDHEVHLASTYDCDVDMPLASLQVVPVAFSGAAAPPQMAARGDTGASTRGQSILRRRLPVGTLTTLRQWFGPLTLSRPAEKLREIIARIQPELVHAMRIPYEGMLAALALSNYQPESAKPPFLISVWGNDFTLHAPATRLMKKFTRLSLAHSDAVHADCQRDIDLAYTWGFQAHKSTIVLPGGGGVQVDLFYPPEKASPTERKQPEGIQYVINPRGVRAYIQNEAFFHAIPRVLSQLPDVRFICPAMAGHPQAARWLSELGIQAAVELLPVQTRLQMADLFRRALVTVSPATHDGTPNTLLEAMACGCFPIAGDIQSLREWIDSGVNGILVDPTQPAAIAEAIINALEDEPLRQRAAQYNTRLIVERAEYWRVMQKAENFYRSLELR